MIKEGAKHQHLKKKKKKKKHQPWISNKTLNKIEERKRLEKRKHAEPDNNHIQRGKYKTQTTMQKRQNSIH